MLGVAVEAGIWWVAVNEGSGETVKVGMGVNTLIA